MRVPTTNRLLKFLTFQVNDLLQFPAMKAPLRADARLGYVLHVIRGGKLRTTALPFVA